MQFSRGKCPIRRSGSERISSSKRAAICPQLKRRSDIFFLLSAWRKVNNRPMREIVFDTETTGLNPSGGDRMVEIGCVEIFNRVETGRQFHAYFNPDRPMPSEAEAVHGLTSIFLSDKPRFGERAAELLDFLGDAPLVAHNASFDFGFLHPELPHCGAAAGRPRRAPRRSPASWAARRSARTMRASTPASSITNGSIAAAAACAPAGWSIPWSS